MKALAGWRKIWTGVCLLCESVAAVSCQKDTALHVDSWVGAPPLLLGIAWEHMALTTLTDTLYILNYSPNLARWLFIQIWDPCETRQSITQWAWESSILGFFFPFSFLLLPFIAIPLKCALIYCVPNHAALVGDVIARRKMTNEFQSSSAFLFLNTRRPKKVQRQTELVVKIEGTFRPEVLTF